MSSDLTTQAVDAALKSDWQEAIKANLSILDENPKDIGALNRLARAYKECGDAKSAQKMYRRVLSSDRFNPIALKNLKLLEVLPYRAKKGTKRVNNLNNSSCYSYMFLEEPGRTKIATLVNLAPNSVLSSLSCGDQINLLNKRRTTVAVDNNGVYLGALPDDLSLKLIKLIKGGNRYEAFVKTVARNNLSIFIREIYRSPRVKNQPAFPGISGEYHYATGPEIVLPNEEPETEETPPEEVSETE